MAGFIGIKNDGQKIVETNFWETDYAHNGICYLSINAGCYRLLIPENRRDWLREINTAKEIIISRGPAPQASPPKSDALEILFEDGTDSPFMILIGPEQVERMPADADHGWKGVMHIYDRLAEKPLIEFTRVYYRRVKKLPYMKRVEENG